MRVKYLFGSLDNLFVKIIIHIRLLLYLIDKIITELLICPDPDSNWKHTDLQSIALPIELSGHKHVITILYKKYWIITRLKIYRLTTFNSFSK